MTETGTPERAALRADVRDLCARFGDEYWRGCDAERAYPEAFVDALTEAGHLAALIPQAYGKGGLGLADAVVIMEEINRSGANSAACHAQMYTMGALLRHGSEAQKDRWMPEIAAGRLRLQAFSITEPEAGSDTTAIRTTARHDGDGWVVDGHKNWTSRIEQSDLLMLLARTAPRPEDPARRAEGISLFLVDLREVRRAQPEALAVDPVRTMFTYATNEVRYRGMRIPFDSLVGHEGEGFRYVIDGWNAERLLLASEAIGDGFLGRAGQQQPRARLPRPARAKAAALVLIGYAAAASSTSAPIGSQRTRERISCGARANSRSISARPSRKCFQPS